MERLESEGFVTGIPVLSSEEVAKFRADVDRFQQKFPEHVKKLKSRSEALAPWIVELAKSPRLIDLFEDIWGPNLLLRNMAWRIKQPDGKVFAGWHQDTAAYGDELSPRHYLGVLALSRCDAKAGCLQVIPGSHKGPVLRHQDYDDPTSILARGQQIVDSFDKAKAEDLALNPGEMALFNPGVIHGSGTNTGDDARVMVLVTLIPTHAKPLRGREPAMLVRGVDEYKHFDVEPQPDEECSPQALASWKDVIETRARIIFGNTHLAPSEAYGGTRPAA
jgi:ectoine hydroxylase-related dioxygenase (phytanoyl-CoA dioxygenase family)